MFEAMMMNKEIDNPQFRFLFENRCPAHIYYRWKLFSVLQGDAVANWSTEDFRMFKGGSTWRPPAINPFAQGMSDDLFSSDDEDDESRRRSLSKSQKKRLELMLRKLTPERAKVTEAMIFCIEHAEASDEIIDFLVESLNSVKTVLPKKLGRFFLVSDVLYNSSSKAVNASNFRSGLQGRLVDVLGYMHSTLDAMESRLKAEAFKQRVLMCLRAWRDWNVYPADFLGHLQNVFLGLAQSDTTEKARAGTAIDEDVDGVPLEEDAADDVDGAPLSDSDDVDGVPLDGAALLRSAVKLQSEGGVATPPATPATAARSLKARADPDDDDDDDVDGVPMSEDLDDRPSRGVGKTPTPARPAPPAASKWQKADVVPASKWERLDAADDDDDAGAREKKRRRRGGEDMFSEAAASSSDDDAKRRDASPLDDSSQEAPSRHSTADSKSEERRVKLREIEVKVVRYQDELESGVQSRIAGLSVADQVQQYRQQLLRKATRSNSDEPRREARRDAGRTASSSAASTSASSASERGSSSRSSTSHKDASSSKRSRSRSRSRSPKKSSRAKRSARSRSSSPDRSSRRYK